MGLKIVHTRQRVDYTWDFILHRVDGPARIWRDGKQEWFLNGKQLPAAEIERWIKERCITIPFDKQTQVEFLMRWG